MISAIRSSRAPSPAADTMSWQKRGGGSRTCGRDSTAKQTVTYSSSKDGSDDTCAVSSSGGAGRGEVPGCCDGNDAMA